MFQTNTDKNEFKGKINNVSISCNTCKVEGEIALGKDREPIYAVDDITGQVYFLTGEEERTSYQVK